MFGEEQMRWLRESLLSSQAVFKIIVNGNQMLNPLNPWESWSKFPEEQQRFFEFLKKSKIEGVIFLSGDRHFSELLKRDDITGYPLYDFTSSPLSAGNARPAKVEEENPYRVANTLVTGVKNFGLVEVSGKKGERKLILKNIDLNGETRWTHEISEKDLKIKR
jgi:alkaline phosphatase D